MAQFTFLSSSVQRQLNSMGKTGKMKDVMGALAAINRKEDRNPNSPNWQKFKKCFEKFGFTFVYDRNMAILTAALFAAIARSGCQDLITPAREVINDTAQRKGGSGYIAFGQALLDGDGKATYDILSNQKFNGLMQKIGIDQKYINKYRDRMKKITPWRNVGSSGKVLKIVRDVFADMTHVEYNESKEERQEREKVHKQLANYEIDAEDKLESTEYDDTKVQPADFLLTQIKEIFEKGWSGFSKDKESVIGSAYGKDSLPLKYSMEAVDAPQGNVYKGDFNGFTVWIDPSADATKHDPQHQGIKIFDKYDVKFSKKELASHFVDSKSRLHAVAATYSKLVYDNLDEIVVAQEPEPSTQAEQKPVQSAGGAESATNQARREPAQSQTTDSSGGGLPLTRQGSQTSQSSATTPIVGETVVNDPILNPPPQVSGDGASLTAQTGGKSEKPQDKSEGGAVASPPGESPVAATSSQPQDQHQPGGESEVPPPQAHDGSDSSTAQTGGKSEKPQDKSEGGAVALPPGKSPVAATSSQPQDQHQPGGKSEVPPPPSPPPADMSDVQKADAVFPVVEQAFKDSPIQGVKIDLKRMPGSPNWGDEAQSESNTMDASSGSGNDAKTIYVRLENNVDVVYLYDSYLARGYGDGVEATLKAQAAQFVDLAKQLITQTPELQPKQPAEDSKPGDQPAPSVEPEVKLPKEKDDVANILLAIQRGEQPVEKVQGLKPDELKRCIGVLKKKLDEHFRDMSDLRDALNDASKLEIAYKKNFDMYLNGLEGRVVKEKINPGFFSKSVPDYASFYTLETICEPIKDRAERLDEYKKMLDSDGYKQYLEKLKIQKEILQLGEILNDLSNAVILRNIYDEVSKEVGSVSKTDGPAVPLHFSEEVGELQKLVTSLASKSKADPLNLASNLEKEIVKLLKQDKDRAFKNARILEAVYTCCFDDTKNLPKDLHTKGYMALLKSPDYINATEALEKSYTPDPEDDGL